MDSSHIAVLIVLGMVFGTTLAISLTHYVSNVIIRKAALRALENGVDLSAVEDRVIDDECEE